MSSFFPSSSASYKPQAQIRQEGFHPHNDGNTPPPNNYDLFNPFLPDAFRKFPSTSTSIDFNDELATLISHDRSHRHNIFDVSASDAPAYPPHFNQTLPALNSSLRYENDTHPPSAYHPHFSRHTPSPNSSSHPAPARPRSRSRPSSAGPPPASAPAGPATGSIGPARTTRARRNNSVSSTSPPPGRPHAIVIPRSRPAPVSSATNWYIQQQHSHSTTSEYSLPTPDSLSSHHLSPSLSASSPPQHQYTPFSLSPPPDPAQHTPNPLHLPPVSALHSLHGGNGYSSLHSHMSNGSPHSLPANIAIPSIPNGRSDRATTNGHTNGTTAPAANGAVDKQALIANEKRRRRRESHNAVERRRRDNINEKISELATLIPECLLDVGAPASGNPAPNANPSSPTVKTPTDDPASPLDTANPTRDSPDAPSAVSPTPATTTTQGEGLGIVKANKGMILRKSVEYIRYLQQLVEAQGARNRALEAELDRWRSGAGGDASASASAADADDAELTLTAGADLAMYTAGAAYNFGGLPSMPEGEGEGEEGEEGEGEDGTGGEEEGDSMDVEDDVHGRGRTRGVNGNGYSHHKGVRKNGVNGNGHANGHDGKGTVKEEEMM
ncbi:hypothetical protein DXG03_004008, partial [Asterophora parasitica]